MEDPPSYEAAMAESYAQVRKCTSLSAQPSAPLPLPEEPSAPLPLPEEPSAPPPLAEEPETSPVLSEEPSTSPESSEKPTTPSVSEKMLALHLHSQTPSAPSSVPSAAPLPQAMQSLFGSLADETIRKACLDFAENFKNGASVIEVMSFSNIRSCYSLHYKLETFCERRESIVRYGKWNEKPIDGSSHGPEPNLWSIFVVCREKFQNGETHVAIPHSEQLRTCRNCDDRGKEDCTICKGSGWNPCSSCSGDGYLEKRSPCLTCNKTGRLICDPCYSSGRLRCSICDGNKKTKYYKELKVTWTNHVDEYDVNPTDIPVELLKSSNSNEIFCEESPRVQPLTIFPDAAINIASLNLVFKHQKECANKNALLQRHTIRAVPITKISYYCKGKAGEFFIYGTENSVYFENFSELLDYVT